MRNLRFLSKPLFDAKILAILMLKTIPQIEVNIKSSEKKIESISPEIWWQLICDIFRAAVFIALVLAGPRMGLLFTKVFPD